MPVLNPNIIAQQSNNYEQNDFQGNINTPDFFYAESPDMSAKYVPGIRDLEEEARTGMSPEDFTQEKIQELRADQQGFLDYAGAVALGGLAKGALSAVKNLSYIADVQNNYERLFTDKQIEENWLAKLATSGQEKIDELLPIYRRNPDEAFDLDDPGWYASMLQSVVESGVGFGASGAAVGMGVGLAAKWTQLAKVLTADKLRMGIQGVTALTNNYAESTVMALEEFKNSVNKGLGKWDEDYTTNKLPKLKQDIYSDESNKAELDKKAWLENNPPIIGTGENAAKMQDDYNKIRDEEFANIDKRHKAEAEQRLQKQVQADRDKFEIALRREAGHNVNMFSAANMINLVTDHSMFKGMAKKIAGVVDADAAVRTTGQKIGGLVKLSAAEGGEELVQAVEQNITGYKTLQEFGYTDKKKPTSIEESISQFIELVGEELTKPSNYEEYLAGVLSAGPISWAAKKLSSGTEQDVDEVIKKQQESKQKLEQFANDKHFNDIQLLSEREDILMDKTIDFHEKEQKIAALDDKIFSNMFYKYAENKTSHQLENILKDLSTSENKDEAEKAKTLLAEHKKLTDIYTGIANSTTMAKANMWAESPIDSKLTKEEQVEELQYRQAAIAQFKRRLYNLETAKHSTKKVLDSTVPKLQDELNKLEAELKEYHKVDPVNVELENLNSRARAIDNSLQEWIKVQEAYTSENKFTKERLDKYTENAKKMAELEKEKEKIVSKIAAVNKAADKKNTKQQQEKLKELQGTLATLEKEKIALKSVKNELIAKIKQDVQEGKNRILVKPINKQLNSLLAKEEAISNEKDNLLKELSESDKLLKDIGDFRPDITEKIQNLNNTLATHTGIYEAITSELSELNSGTKGINNALTNYQGAVKQQIKDIKKEVEVLNTLVPTGVEDTDKILEAYDKQDVKTRKPIPVKLTYETADKKPAEVIGKLGRNTKGMPVFIEEVMTQISPTHSTASTKISPLSSFTNAKVTQLGDEKQVIANKKNETPIKDTDSEDFDVNTQEGQGSYEDLDVSFLEDENPIPPAGSAQDATGLFQQEIANKKPIGPFSGLANRLEETIGSDAEAFIKAVDNKVDFSNTKITTEEAELGKELLEAGIPIVDGLDTLNEIIKATYDKNQDGNKIAQNFIDKVKDTMPNLLKLAAKKSNVIKKKLLNPATTKPSDANKTVSWSTVEWYEPSNEEGSDSLEVVNDRDADLIKEEKATVKTHLKFAYRDVDNANGIDKTDSRLMSMNKMLTMYLNDPTLSKDMSEGYTVEYQIAFDEIEALLAWDKANLLETNNERQRHLKWKELIDKAKRKESLTAEEVGNLPIKMLIFKDGKPVKATTTNKDTKLVLDDTLDAKNHQLYSFLHDADYDNFDPNNKNTIIGDLRDSKLKIYNNYLKGLTSTSKIKFKTGGVRNSQLSFRNYVGVRDKSEFLIGQKDGIYGTIDADGKFSASDEVEYTSATPGAFYRIVTTSNGKLFPERLFVPRINELFADLYIQILINKPGVNGDKKISELEPVDGVSLSEFITKNKLQDLIPLNTKLKEASKRFIHSNKDVGKSHLNFDGKNVTIGENNITIDFAPNNYEALRDALVANKLFSVDKDAFFGDNKYREYILKNILQTDLKPTATSGSEFLQPTVILDAEITAVENKSVVDTNMPVVYDTTFLAIITGIIGDKIDTPVKAISWEGKTLTDKDVDYFLDHVTVGKTGKYLTPQQQKEYKQKLIQQYREQKEFENKNKVKIGDIDKLTGKPIIYFREHSKLVHVPYNELQKFDLTKLSPKDVVVLVNTPEAPGNIRYMSTSKGTYFITRFTNEKDSFGFNEHEVISKELSLSEVVEKSAYNSDIQIGIDSDVVAGTLGTNIQSLEDKITAIEKRRQEAELAKLKEAQPVENKVVNKYTTLTQSLKDLISTYTGGVKYFPIDSTDIKEILDILKAGGITAQDIFNAHGNWDEFGKLYKWFDKAYKALTGQTLKEAENTTSTEVKPTETPAVQGEAKTARNDIDFEIGESFENVPFRMYDPNTIIDSKEDIAKIKKWFAKHLPNVPLTVVNDLIDAKEHNGKAIGMIFNGMATLYKDAELGTGYHEAFEAVWRYMLKPEQQKDVLNNFKKRKNYKQSLTQAKKLYNYTNEDDYIRETLAEEFRSYVLKQKDIETRPWVAKPLDKIGEFFKWLWDTIKGIFNKQYNADKLYKDILSGKFKHTPLSIPENDRPIYSLLGTTDQESQVIETLAYFTLFTNKVKDFNNIEDIDIDKAGLMLMVKYSEAVKNRNANVNDKYLQSIVDNFERIMPEVYSNWQEYQDYKIKASQLKLKYNSPYVTKLNESLKRFGIVTDEEYEEDEKREAFNIKPSYSVSTTERASVNIKLFLATVPKIIGKDSTTGQYIYERGDFLGLPRYNNFIGTFNLLRTNLAGIVPTMVKGKLTDSLTTMLKKLHSLAQFRPELEFIANEVAKFDEYKQNEFHAVFSAAKLNNRSALLSGDFEYKDKVKVNNRFFKHDEGGSNSAEALVLNEWSETFKEKLLVIENDEEVANKPAIAAIIGNYNSFYKVLVGRLNKKSQYDEKQLREAVDTTINELLPILSSIGIDTTANAIKYGIQDYRTATPKLHSKDDLDVLKVIIVDHLRYVFTDTNGNTLTTLLNGKAEVFEGQEDSVVEDTPILDNRGPKMLAYWDSLFRDDLQEVTSLDAQGNRRFDYAAYDYTSKSIAKLQNGDFTDIDNRFGVYKKNTDGTLVKDDKGNPVREPGKGKPYYQFSLWMNQLASNPSIARILKLLNFMDLKDEASKDSLAFDEIKIADDIAIRLSAILQANPILPLLNNGDHGTYKELKGFELVKGLVDYDNNTGKYVASDEAIKIFTQYLAGELLQMRVEYDKLTDTNVDTNQLSTFYHGKVDKKTNKIIVKDKDGNFTGNVFKSYLFPELGFYSDSKLGIELGLYELDANGNPIPRPHLLNGKFTVGDTTYESFFKEPKLKAYIAGQLNKLLDKSFDLVEQYKTKDALEKGTVSDYNISNAVLNGLIANIEYSMMFLADPRYAKDTKDMPKRVSSAIASGTDLRIYESSDTIAPFDEDTDKNSDEYKYAVRPYFRQVTVQNITHPSKYLKEILQSLKDSGISEDKANAIAKAYKDVNVTDAQGYMTTKRLREIYRGLGLWNKNFERIYQAKLKKDNTLSPAELKDWYEEIHKLHIYFESVKGVCHDIDENGVPVYLKYSLATLLPNVTFGTPLDKLRVAMEKSGVDEAVVLDGVKKGGNNPVTILDEKGKILDNIDFKPSIKKISNTNWHQQQVTPVKGIENRGVGSQLMKNIYANIKKAANYIIGGEDMKGDKVITELNTVVRQLSDIGANELSDKWELGKIGNTFRKLKDSLITKIKSQANYSAVTVEALSRDYALDTIPGSRETMQNMIHAELKRSTVKLEQSGGAFVQVSAFGISGDKFKGIDTNTLQEQIIFFNKTKQLNPPLVRTDEKTGKKYVVPGQVLLPYSLIEHIPNWEQKVADGTITNYIDKRLLNIIGYRIPNQGIASNDCLEVVGVLPKSMGDSIISYEEITAKTGSDFDIDKMFIMTPNYKWNGKQLVYVEFLDATNSTPEQRYTTYLLDSVDSDVRKYVNHLSEDEKLEIKEEFEKLGGKIDLINKISNERFKSFMQDTYKDVQKEAKEWDVQKSLDILVGKANELWEELPQQTKDAINKGTYDDNTLTKIGKWIANIEAIKEKSKHKDTLDMLSIIYQEELVFLGAKRGAIQDYMKEVAAGYGQLTTDRVKAVIDKTIKAKNSLIDRKFELYKELDTKLPSKEDFNKLDIYKQNTKKALQNRRLELYTGILTSVETYSQLMTSIDSKWLPEHAKYLMKLAGDEEQASGIDWFSFINQVIEKFKMLGGKSGVGQVANHMVGHNLFQSIMDADDLPIRTTRTLGRGNTITENGEEISVFNEMETESIEGIDEDGNITDMGKWLVSDTVAAYLNAYVDIAKDPYIYFINNNTMTTPIVMMLLRAGFNPMWVNAFMKQPIIVDLVKQTFLDQSMTVEPEYSEITVNGKKIKKFLSPEDKVRRDYAITSNDTSVDITKVKDINLKKLHDSIKDGGTNQEYMLNLFNYYMEMSKDFGKIVRLMKVDVNGAGKNMIETKAIKNLKKQLETSEYFRGLDGIFNNSSTTGTITAKFYENSVEFVDKLKRLFLSETKGFDRQLSTVFEKVYGRNMTTETDAELGETIYRHWFAYLNSIEENPLRVDEDTADEWLYGTDKVESLATQLWRLQRGDNKAIKNNLVIKLLTPKFGSKKNGRPDTITKNNFRYLAASKDQVIQAFEELLQNPETAEFANKLARFSLVTSGFVPHSTSYYDILPLSILDTKYDKFIKNLWDLSEADNGPFNEFIDQFFRHNYNNKKLVPRIPANNAKKIEGVPIMDAMMVQIEPKANIAVPYIIETPEGTRTKYMAKPYVKYVHKIEYTDKKGKLAKYDYVQLYELVGVDSDNNAVYVAVPKLGMDERGRKVVEYDAGKKKTKSNLAFNNKRVTNEYLGYIAKHFNLTLPDITVPENKADDMDIPQEETTQQQEFRPAGIITPIAIVRAVVKENMTESMKGSSAEKHLPKELLKVDIATQFIGEGSGSTGKHAESWLNLANTGKYSSQDVIMLAANGNRSGRFKPVINGVLQGAYKNIDLAIQAGASFVADTEQHLANNTYNIGEIELANYLLSKGYTRDNSKGVGLWTKTIQQPVAKSIELGRYVKYNNNTYIVTQLNANDTVQIYNPLLEGAKAKLSVAKDNIELLENKAKIVNYKDSNYIVTAKKNIISLTSNKLMKWGEENGDRKNILELAKQKSTEPNKAEIKSIHEEEKEKEQRNIDINQGLRDKETILKSMHPKEILNNKEIRVLTNKKVNLNNIRVASASERSDPAFHSKEIVKEITNNPDKYDMLYIVTKHDGKNIQNILKLNIPKVIHFSITSLGGSKYEPGVMKYTDMLDRIQYYINNGLEPEAITVRIDPIVPNLTKFEDITNIVDRAYAMGIRNIRMSVMDYYGYVKTNMDKLGYNWNEVYTEKETRNGKFGSYQVLVANKEYFSKIAALFDSLQEKYKDIEFTSCAENKISNNIKQLGCLNTKEIAFALGKVESDITYKKGNQRDACACFGGKIDLLSYNHKCASNCTYCYAKHAFDKNDVETIEDVDLSGIGTEYRKANTVNNLQKGREQIEKCKAANSAVKPK